eukprot:9865535-Ditylum_brightwellii.AAC.1
MESRKGKQEDKKKTAREKVQMAPQTTDKKQKDQNDNNTKGKFNQEDTAEDTTKRNRRLIQGLSETI